MLREQVREGGVQSDTAQFIGRYASKMIAYIRFDLYRSNTHTDQHTAWYADRAAIMIAALGAHQLPADTWSASLIVQTRRSFAHGVVLYAGDKVLPFRNRLAALPLQALWI